MSYQIISIIGGKWEMWKLYCSMFKKAWYKVLISDIWTKLTNKQVASKWDIVLISVPIDKTVEVINEISWDVRKDACIFDVTSIKKKPLKAMLRTLASDVVWIHPMHRNTVPVAWQTYIFCRWRWTKWYNFLKKFFKNTWAIIEELDVDEHDKMMSVIQWLSHFTEIVFAKSLEKLGVDLDQIFRFQSPSYRLKFNMMWRILSQDANLYWNIQIQNKESVRVISKFIESANELMEINKNKDLKMFETYFNKSKEFLWDYAVKALKESDKIIKDYYK